MNPNDIYTKGLQAFSNGDLNAALALFSRASVMGHPNAKQALLKTQSFINSNANPNSIGDVVNRPTSMLPPMVK